MKLFKEARILNSDTTVKENWTDAPTERAAPGEYIEYRITYENISETQQGSGNVILNAQDFILYEDGNKTNVTSNGDDNNWADSTTHQQATTTGGVGSGSTVKYYTGSYVDDTTGLIGSTDPSNGSTVDSYKNEVGTVAPGITGTFKFRRQVNGTINQP
jgi:hypothetical protein